METFLRDPNNIGLKTFFPSSVSLISNIVLLIEEAITGKQNDKDPTFDKEPLPDNDEVTALDLTPLKKSAIEDGINYVSYFMGSMALDARARLKVNEIVPRVGLHGILMR